jgi:symplekin
VHPLIEALVRWEPHALAGESVSRMKSAEKTAYILLGHLLRYVQSCSPCLLNPAHPQVNPLWIFRKDVARPFVSEVTRALDTITERINKLVRLEHVKRVEAAAKRVAGEAAEPSLDAKRIKLDSDAVSLMPTSAAQALVGFDWRTMGRDVVTDLIVANLQHFSEPAVLGAIAVSGIIPLPDSTPYRLDWTGVSR